MVLELAVGINGALAARIARAERLASGDLLAVTWTGGDRHLYHRDFGREPLTLTTAKPNWASISSTRNLFPD